MSEYISTPKKIQFELSSMCNALCLGCVRTDSKNFNISKAFIAKKQLVEVETVVKLLSDDLMKTVELVEFCGTIDEPLMHPRFFDIIKELYKINPQYNIIIHTNASIRGKEEWAELAGLLQKFKHHRVSFSIDGLSDTHELYRQKTSYEKIIENAQAFIDAGGNAAWQFLVFPWNKHQVEEARAISSAMRFRDFIVRHDRSIVSNLGLDKIVELKNKDNRSGNNDSTTIEQLLESYQNINSIEIECFNKNEGMYFVSYDSRLWPCCFVPNGFLQQRQVSVDFLTQRLYNQYGEDFNDLTEHSVSDIVNGDFFKNDLVESWSNPVSTAKCGKITRCAETCNVQKLKALPIGKHKILRNSQ
jgi:MoaA/NifB/PqqE/SkfB family radical SAM enzyme